jgi:uncharacterized membrane protein
LTAPATATTRPINAARVPATYTFETISVPGSRLTAPQGINPAGDIVGQFVDADFVTHGFLLHEGVFTSIDFPGADATSARGIGPGGEIVGTYWNRNEEGSASHSYRLSPEGEFTTIEYPGHLYSIAQRILPDGTVLGCYHDHDNFASMKGAVYSSGGTSDISQFASMINGATPDRRYMVGIYVNTALGNRSEAFTMENGEFTPLFVPGSIMTAAWDINPRGQIAGIYRDGAGFHGYVLSGRDFSTMVTLNFPGAAGTRAFGINARGDVVGTYGMGGHTYGYLAHAGN